MVGGLNTIAVFCIVALGIGFIPEVGGAVGLFASTRLWFAGAMLMTGFGILFSKRNRFWAYCIMLAAAFFVVTTYPFSSGRALNENLIVGQHLKVINFNILGDNFDNGRKIASFLVDQDADIVIVQEALPLLPFLNELARTYPYSIGCAPPNGICDLLLLSRHELLTSRTTNLSQFSRNRAHFSTIEINGNKFGVAAVHLTKPYFDSASVIELTRLSSELKSLPENVILGGDFNSASWAPDQQRFLDSQQLKAYWHEPPTWPVWMGGFGIAIDHIYVAGKRMNLTNISPIPDAHGSNHRGIIATIFVAE